MSADRRDDSTMNHIDHRVNEIEAEVVGLKVAVGAIDEKIDRHTTVITDLLKDDKSSPRTWLTFLGVGLSFVVFYNQLTIQPVTQSIEFNRQVAAREAALVEKDSNFKVETLDSHIDSIEYWLEGHIKDNTAHPETLLKIKELATRIKVLEHHGPLKHGEH